MKKKLLKSMRVLLVAAGLCVGASAWADTETISGDSYTKETDWSFTSVTILGAYLPDKSAQTINGKSCSKVRCRTYKSESVVTVGGFALVVNDGYKVTNLSMQLSSQNSDNGATITKFVVDGKDLNVSNVKVNNAAAEYPIIVPGHNGYTEYKTVEISDIEATNYINFVAGGESTNTNNQMFVYITVTYEEVNKANVFSLDFEDAETYKNGWTITSGIDATQSAQSNVTGSTKFLQLKKNNTNSGTYNSYLDFTASSLYDAFSCSPLYKFTFWYACSPARTYSGSSGTNGESIITSLIGNIGGVSTTLFTARTIGESTTTNVYKGDDTSTSLKALTTDNRWTTPTKFFKFEVEQTFENDNYSVKLTITNASGTVQLSSSVLYTGSTPCYLSKLNNGQICRYGNTYTGFDDMTLQVDLSNLLERASAASSSASTLLSAKMNSTVKSTLTSAISSTSSVISLTAAEINSSNISAFVTGVVTLESAVSAAEASSAEYTLWKAVYDAADAKALTVNAACQTAFETATSSLLSAYTDGSLSLPANTNAVKGYLAQALVDAGETDLTAVIYNAGFELGTIDGWTIAGNPASVANDADMYGTIENTYVIDGSYHYYTGYNGRNVSQIIAGLPTGYYTLTAKANSWGASCALVANGGASDVYASISSLTQLSYQFYVYGDEEAVNIGIAGTNGATSPYPEGGSWGYRCDAFTLTYTADPAATEKSSLRDEIETATTLYNSWTPKVGTAPFKYDATYYNALGTQITTATSVLNGGSTTASDYTTAETNLETAEGNMASSSLNQPDASKYYRLFLAGTSLNLNMLHGKSMSITLSSTPAAVKIVPVTSGYNIRSVYDENLQHNKDNASSWGAGSNGIEKRGERFTASVQEDGTVQLTSAYVSIVLSATSQTDGSYVGRNGSYTTWEVSEPVDVTDVNLAVNATAGWGTFIAPYDNLTPSTVKAYTVSYKDGNTIYFTENETGVLSANTPYILSTEESENVSTTFTDIANNTEDTYTVNGLVGLLTAGTVAADKYILQYNDGVVGFYKTTTSITGTANRCYLDLANVPTEASSARAFVSFGIFDGDATGIKTVEGSQLKAENFYNLSGQRISQPTKGLYIVGGKKVVVK